MRYLKRHSDRQPWKKTLWRSTMRACKICKHAMAPGPGGRFWASRRDGYLAWRLIEFGNETSYAH